MPRYFVMTKHPVAEDSYDHQHALYGGAANDNSRNPHFNERLYALYPDTKIQVLDLGCAGGGFVKNLLEDGHEAVGLEGSDHCLKNQKFNWSELANKNLFTCDVTKPFSVCDMDLAKSDASDVIGGRALCGFDVVTAWEVMEHFHEHQLADIIDNVLRHLKPGGIWVMSVSEQPDGGKFHKTLHHRDWWVATLTSERVLYKPYRFRLREDLIAHFGKHWVRGPERTPWAFDAPQSFHLVLSKESVT